MVTANPFAKSLVRLRANGQNGMVEKIKEVAGAPQARRNKVAKPQVV
jgi:hypothetical protein